jgi:putative flippase GtrA
MTNADVRSSTWAEVLRYFVNGVVGTVVHFTALVTCIELVGMPSAGLANLVASLFGIAASFIGNRYFVFRSHTARLKSQAARFVFLYAAIASLHAGLLFVWSDLWGLDYRIGFLLALATQVVLGFWGNKTLVFAK